MHTQDPYLATKQLRRRLAWDLLPILSSLPFSRKLCRAFAATVIDCAFLLSIARPDGSGVACMGLGARNGWRERAHTAWG